MIEIFVVCFMCVCSSATPALVSQGREVSSTNQSVPVKIGSSVANDGLLARKGNDSASPVRSQSPSAAVSATTSKPTVSSAAKHGPSVANDGLFAGNKNDSASPVRSQSPSAAVSAPASKPTVSSVTSPAVPPVGSIFAGVPPPGSAGFSVQAPMQLMNVSEGLYYKTYKCDYCDF